MASLARRRAAQTDFWRCGLDWLEGPNSGELVVVARARRLTATQPPIKAAHAGKTDLVIASIAARSRRQCADLSVQVSGPCCQVCGSMRGCSTRLQNWVRVGLAAENQQRIRAGFLRATRATPRFRGT